jgi:superfamily II DNA or RNA helicase
VSGIELREYQEDALARVAGAEARGVRRQLIVAATGLGKTVMFVMLAKRRGGRCLVLVHRDELVQQAVAKVREVWPDVSVGIVKAAENDVRHQVVVASVQTLARPKRLTDLLAPFDSPTLLGKADRFELVVVDEAHHATADTYGRVLDGLRAGAPVEPCPICEGSGQDVFDESQPCDRCAGSGGTPEGPLLVGVTATPDRADGAGLSTVFGEIVSNHDMLWGISAGYLSELRGLQVRVSGLDTQTLKVSRGDYEAGAAGQLLHDAHAPDYIVKAWKEHAEGRRTIVFTPTVEVAHEVSRAFAHAGVPSASVSGSTPLDERRRILADFARGEISVVANCAVLTEGYDNPEVSCIVIARPTKSRGLYTQMVGRGTRRHPAKEDCLVLDVVGASEDMNLVTIPSLFGVVDKRRRHELGRGGAVSQLVLEDRHEQVKLGAIQAEEIALFRKITATGIVWVKAPDPRWEHATRYLRSLGRDKAGLALPTVVLARVQEGGDHWVAGIRDGDTKQVLIMDVPLETAQGVAEDYVRKHGAAHLVEADAKWRKKPPTPKQLGAAAKWHLPVDPLWNAGQLSEALDAHIAKIDAKKERARRAKENQT